MKTLDSLLAELEELPPAPFVMMRVLQLTEQPEVGVAELVEAIEIDPAVTANIIRVGNTAMYAGNQRFSTLREVVLRLGTATLLQILVANQSRAILDRACVGYGLGQGDLWRHSVGAALGSRLLAQRIGHPQPWLVFTGGLLHDLGKLVLDLLLREEYRKIQERVSQGATFYEAEKEVLGMDHAELGGRIAERWGFPESLIHMICHHHTPMGAPSHQDLCGMVHLGDAMTHWLGIGLGRPGLANCLEPQAVERLGLEPPDLDELLVSLAEKMEQTELLLAA